MAANVYMKSISLGSQDYAKLAASRTIMNATIIASIKNPNPINVRVLGGTPALWPPGATVQLFGVDLSEIEVQGQAGNSVLVVGVTE